MENKPISLEALITATEGQFPTELLVEDPPNPEPPEPKEPPTDPPPNPEPAPLTKEPSLPEPGEPPAPGSSPEPMPPDPEPEPHPEPAPPPGEPSDEDKERLTATYSLLAENGYLNPGEDFEFDGTPESFEKAIESTRKNNYQESFQALWNTLDKEGQDYLRYKLKNKGSSLHEFYSFYINPTIESISDLSLDTIANQKEVVTANLKLTSQLTDDKISKLVDQFEASGSLSDEAKEAKEALIEYHNQYRESILDTQEREQEQYRAALNETIQSSNLIPDTRKNIVRNFMVNEVEKRDGVMTEFNRTLRKITQNPEHLAQLADILVDYSDTKGIDLDRFSKQGKSFTVTKFQKQLEDHITNPKSKVKGKTPTPKPDPLHNPIDWEKVIGILE